MISSSAGVAPQFFLGLDGRTNVSLTTDFSWAGDTPISREWLYLEPFPHVRPGGLELAQRRPRMRTRFLSVIVAGALSLGLASPASAGVIEWNNATFQIDLQSFLGNQYTFRLTADFSGFAEVDQTGHFAYLVGINFKPSQGDLVDSSNESTNALGTWIYNVDTNLSSNNVNCANAPGNNNFFCGANTGNWALNPTAGNPIYTWNFTLQINGVAAGQEGSLDDNAPLRVLFSDGAPENQTSLMSLTTAAQVPEPTSLSLVGLGLLAGGLRALRKNRK